jgi:hypothetical protein
MDKVVDGFKGNVIKIDGVCYEFVSFTEDEVNAVDEGVSFSNCEDCDTAASSSSSEILAVPSSEISTIPSSEISTIPSSEISTIPSGEGPPAPVDCGPDGPEASVGLSLYGNIHGMTLVNNKPALVFDAYDFILQNPGSSNPPVYAPEYQSKNFIMASNQAGTTWYPARQHPGGNTFWNMRMATLGPSACKAGHVILATGAAVSVGDQLENPTTFTDVTPWNPAAQDPNSITSMILLDDADKMLVIGDRNFQGTPWTSNDQDPAAQDWTSAGSNTSCNHVTMGLANGHPACASQSGNKFFRANNADGSSWPGSGVTYDAQAQAAYAILEVAGHPALLYGRNSGGSSPTDNFIYYIRANDPNGATWGTPVPIINGSSGSDPVDDVASGYRRADMCKDPVTGTLYVRWTSNTPDTILGTPTTSCYEKYPGYSYCYTNYPDQKWYLVVYGAQSTDNGATWTPYTWEYQVEIPNPSTPHGFETVGEALNFGFVGCEHDGTQVHVAYYIADDDFHNPPFQDPLGFLMYCNGVQIT